MSGFEKGCGRQRGRIFVQELRSLLFRVEEKSPLWFVEELPAPPRTRLVKPHGRSSHRLQKPETDRRMWRRKLAV